MDRFHTFACNDGPGCTTLRLLAVKQQQLPRDHSTKKLIASLVPELAGPAIDRVVKAWFC